MKLSDLSGAARERARALLAAERAAPLVRMAPTDRAALAAEVARARARRPAAARSAPRATLRPSGAPHAPTGPLVFVLPMPPSHNRSGRSRHWRTIHEERADFVAACDARQAAGLLPPPPAQAFASARLDCHLIVGALNDDDNAHARTKWGRDWLVTRGYLVSDRPTLRGRPCLVRGALTQEVTRKQPAALVLTLTPLGPTPTHPAPPR